MSSLAEHVVVFSLNFIEQVMFKTVFGCGSLIFIANSFPSARHRHVFHKHLLFEMAEKHPVGFFRNVLNVIPFTRNSAICPYGLTFDKQLTHIASPVLTYSGPLNVIFKDNAHPLNLRKAYLFSLSVRNLNEFHCNVDSVF